uniref:Ig-like domain-containing protein n=2 Tax=Biomphalaria glabrata TaxID=6526 RepID=A0A2C9KL77_BIOGL
MLKFKLYEQGIKFYLHLILLVEHVFSVKAQEVAAVISVEIQSTSSYSIVADIRNDIYSKLQEDLFNKNVSTITLKYLYLSNPYINSIETIGDQCEKENLYSTCFVNESIMAIQCHKNISCTIQNCTSCNDNLGIRWIYNGSLSSKYLTNKTELCDDGKVIVMYAIAQNVFSTSTVTASTTSLYLKTVCVTKTFTIPPDFTTATSANLTLQERNSKDMAGVIAGVTVSVIVLVTVAVLIVFMWRKRKSKTNSSCGNDSQNMSRQNNNYVRSPEDVIVRDVKKETYNKPMSSTTYLEPSSNNLNNDPIKITIKSEPETSIYTGIDDDVSAAQLNVFNSDYEKSDTLDNYTTARRSNEQPEISTCTFSNENDYNVIDYSQVDTNFRDSSLATNHFDDGYSSVDMPREITYNNNADFSQEIQSTVETAVDECSQVDQHSYNVNHKNVSNYMNLPKDIENTTQNQRNVYSKLRENISKFKDTYGDLETLAQEENDPSQPSETDTYFTLETEDVSTDTDKIEFVD